MEHFGNRVIFFFNPSSPFIVSKGLFGRATAPLVEWLLWWSWSRFEKCLAKRLHQFD
jgi:hypothetical protein